MIHRADPALGNTDQVLKILAGQNRALAKLATDSATVLGPLAQQRKALADFVVQANTTSVASAQRAQRHLAVDPAAARRSCASCGR